MFCQKCGAANSDEAVYCLKCGSKLENEIETQVVARSIKSVSEDDESEIFSLRPTLLFVKIGYGLAVIGAFILVWLLTNWISSPLILVLLGLSMLLIPAYFHLKRNIVRYKLTDSKVEIDEGFIFQKTRNIPLRSIQDVSVSSSIAQRMLGYGDLIIDNASEDGGKIVLRNINQPKKHADILLKQMRQLNK